MIQTIYVHKKGNDIPVLYLSDNSFKNTIIQFMTTRPKILHNSNSYPGTTT